MNDNGKDDKTLKGLVLPEQQKHAEYVVKVNHVGKRRALNTTENILDVYLNRGFLDGSDKNNEARLIGISRHAAGMHLYKDFYASRMVGGFKSCLNITIGGGGGMNKAGMNYQAYQSYLSALESIHSKRARKLVVNVCCIGEWLKDINGLSIPVHKRMGIFLQSLDSLIEHYDRQINSKKVMISFNASLTTTTGQP